MLSNDQFYRSTFVLNVTHFYVVHAENVVNIIVYAARAIRVHA